MFDFFEKIYEGISAFDIIYLIITFFSVTKCLRKGFVLSILAASKWLLAYVITLILFPKTKPLVEGFIDNEYVLDIFLGVTIFSTTIFIILMINKGISKAVKYSGLGRIDAVFGFFFGFIRGYIISVCLFSAITIVYNYSKWPINYNESFIFPYVKKGSNYLIEEFPNEKNYEKTKDKIEEL